LAAAVRFADVDFADVERELDGDVRLRELVDDRLLLADDPPFAVEPRLLLEAERLDPLALVDLPFGLPLLRRSAISLPL